VDNHEGLVDAVLFGLSISRVALEANGGGFFVVTAGSPVANASTLTGNPRWERLLAGFEEAGVTLLLYTGSSESTAGVIAERAAEVFVLAEADEPLPEVAMRRPEHVTWVTGPPSEVQTSDEHAPIRPVSEGTDTVDLGFPQDRSSAPTQAMEFSAPEGPDPEPTGAEGGVRKAPTPVSSTPASRGPTKGGAKPSQAGGSKRTMVLLAILAAAVILYVLFGFTGPVDSMGSGSGLDLAAFADFG
jgi:hypothetical protein